MSMRLNPYPAYKESGVQWLGRIPEHWETKKIKHSSAILRGMFTHRPRNDPKMYDGPYPFIQTGDVAGAVKFVREHHQTLSEEGFKVSKMFPRGTLVMTIAANVGDMAILDFEACFPDSIVGFVPRNDAHLGYLYYLFAAMRPQFMATATINTQLNLNIDRIGALWTGLPPRDEQQAIASFLDRETEKIDALIKKKERLIGFLKEKRTAMISHAVTQGLNPNVAKKESGVPWLGEIPEHWEVKRLAVIACKITNGFVGPTRDILVDEGVRYLQSLHIKNGQIRFDTPYYVRPEWSKEHSKSVLAEGDVLIVQTGDLGQCCAVPKEFEGTNCHALIIVRLRLGIGSGFFLSAFLRSAYGRASLQCCEEGATLPHLECGKIREIPIALPPPEEQQDILSFLDQETSKLDALVAKVQTAIERLQEYRTALISAAVTGQIDVRN